MRTSALGVLDPADTAAAAVPSIDELILGEVIDGRYRLRAPLGTGATSTVWLAYDERLRRPVAIKELPRHRQPEQGAAELEARTAAGLASPHIVKVYDFIADDSSATDWIVMEALTGRDLGSVLSSDHHVCSDEALYIGRHVADALVRVHGAGLIHRDVKPSNIHLCQNGRVVLTDFGLATVPHITGGVASGQVVGSLPYLAPEILTQGRYSSASDFYALGMTLYAAVTGRPVTGPDDLRSDRDARPDVDALLRLPRDLRPLLQGLLDPDPRTRFDARATDCHLTQRTS